MLEHDDLSFQGVAGAVVLADKNVEMARHIRDGDLNSQELRQVIFKP